MRFCCPVCRGELDEIAAGRRCAACERTFAERFGFLDFRLGAATEVDVSGDLERAEALAARETEFSFDELFSLLLTLAPRATNAIDELHRAHFEAEAEQAEAAFARLSAAGPGPALDVGCGMGQYLVAAARAGRESVGADVSLAQLVLARKRLSEAGLQATLVAAEAQDLPFPHASFAAAVAADLVEHLDDREGALREIGRTMRPGGGLYISTPNRFSLTPEPHVAIWGLGLLPRKAAIALVRRRLGVDYSHIRLLSHGGLKRLLREHWPGESEIRPPVPGPRELATFSPLKRGLAKAYGALAGVAPLRPLMRLAAPYFQAFCWKR